MHFLFHDVLSDVFAHKSDIDQLCSDFLISCLNVGKESIPSRKNSSIVFQDGMYM